MTGTDDSNLVYSRGLERIPDNWYTRAVGDPYDVAFLSRDLGTMAQQHPETQAFGGNTGTVNSLVWILGTSLSVSPFPFIYFGLRGVVVLLLGHNPPLQL